MKKPNHRQTIRERRNRPFNLEADPHGLKIKMKESKITLAAVAERAQVSYQFAYAVLSGRKTSSYVETAAKELLAASEGMASR